MLSFIVRRVFVSALLLLGASFIMYILTALSGDPLEELRGSRDPNRAQLIQLRSDQLNLDVPAPLRYFGWLAGAAKCLIPMADSCDLGVNILNQPVTGLIPMALDSTIQLITGATLLAIVVGITIGIVSALRHNTGFDYSVTFIIFLLFSMPAFWIAVLLKEFLAIGFNDFLAQPVISLPAILGIAVVAGIIWQAMVAGPRRRRVIVFVISGLATTALLVFFNLSDWFRNPGLGAVMIAVSAFGVAVLVTGLIAGFKDRRAMTTALINAGLAVIAYFTLQNLFDMSSWATISILAVATLVVGLASGWLVGGDDRAVSMRIGAITAVLSGGLLLIDRFMQSWALYSADRAIGGRPIATVGSSTPTLDGDIWIMGIDTFTHFLLPTISLTLISLAGYTRYVRSGMLDVLDQDYIRTARAKGLDERTVIVRHAFRNALIPLATLVAADIGAIIGGAIITEQVFAISGMGQLFIRSLSNVDPNPVMAYFVVVSIVALIANLIADLSYAALDPRVRTH
ncbi:MULTISPECIES: ABC transporter permease [Cryobacterium]|uniref:ABC transporter permease n=1 Tax=Cryobacterium levicorallinum TaxID=995038 RepID=A0A1I3BH33_9MICO|nr:MULTISPECIES: ABC transporter permease [Cryobacterium]TFB82039.1 ABC transporter permease [Cryobacterium levicorallinum]TFD57006.1 ABC transporter permease [Cryobacterium sp. Hh38]SFH61041.1 peptide/nickel transport system permease protein [Cryobacterium levicorallinum]